MSNASNQHGQCIDSAVWVTRDPEANAVGDTFASMVSNVPYVGGFVAGLVPDTFTQNAVRSCPGAVVDWTPDYTQEMVLMALIVVLIVIYLLM